MSSIFDTKMARCATAVAASAALLCSANNTSANIIGPEDGRGPITELGSKLGLSAAEIEQIRNSTGYAYCPGGMASGRPKVGSAALLLAPDIMITAAHVIIRDDGRPLAECFFQNQPGSLKYDRVPLGPLPEARYFGVEKLVIDDPRDFAASRLARAASGAKPFAPYSGSPDTLVGRRVFLISAGQPRVKGSANHTPIIQECTIRAATALLYTDCDVDPMASGGAFLIREAGELRIAGIVVSSALAASDGQAFGENSYTTGIALAGVFLDAARALAKGRPLPPRDALAGMTVSRPPPDAFGLNIARGASYVPVHAGGALPEQAKAASKEANSAALILGGGRCTASFLDRDIIITAAHCFRSGTEGWTLALGVDADDIERQKQRGRALADVRIHPDFKREPGTGRTSNDLAIARLDRPVDDGVRIARLDLAAALGFLAGKEGLKLDNLGYAVSKPAGRTEHVASLRGRVLRLDGETFFTAGHVGCDGDSGGPIFLNEDGDVRLMAMLVAAQHSEDCSDPRAYAEILARHYGWIAKTVAELGGKLSDQSAGMAPCVATTLRDENAGQGIVQTKVGFENACSYPTSCLFTIDYTNRSGEPQFTTEYWKSLEPREKEIRLIRASKPEEVSAAAYCVEAQ